tara:strand:- start:209 stop:952 length:744 start_codon:yes stop_codon:yes gene_type:complete
MTSLVIDNREGKIINLIKHLTTDYIVEQLSIGDFLIKIGDSTANTLVVERKSVNDLYQSINDGRYKEQKARLLANFPLSQVIYLIEGDLSDLYSSSHRKAVSGSIFNMQFRDKIRVVRTKDLNDTCDFILSLYSKATKNPEWFITGESQPKSENDGVDYSSLIKVNKSGNMTPEVCQVVMLTHIPGVSHNFSRKILEHYNSLENLINALKSTEIPEGLLTNLQVTDKRKLGKVLAQRIYNYLIIKNQ